MTLRWLERLLLLASLACAGWVCTTWSAAAFYQAYAKSELDHPATSERRPDEAVIGVLSIPRVGVSVAVVEGDDEKALSVAVGHLPDTPLPWEEGNSALAGHRDTYFGDLSGIRPGDAMALATRHGDLQYRVRSVRVVQPTDVSVLKPTGADLTLITCFPFRYIGPAPKRFVVQAERVARAGPSTISHVLRR